MNQIIQLMIIINIDSKFIRFLALKRAPLIIAFLPQILHQHSEKRLIKLRASVLTSYLFFNFIMTIPQIFFKTKINE